MGVVRNILAFVVGVVVAMSVNMALIIASPHVIPPPEGVDVTKMESIKASIHLFQPKHFVMPFLAHALGSFAGAFVAALLAASRRTEIARRRRRCAGTQTARRETCCSRNAWRC